MFKAPPTFLNHVVSPVRTFATASLALSDVKETAKHLGVTFNDMVLAMAAGVLAAGCASDPKEGYSFRSTFPTDVRSVQVPIFANTTSEPGREYLLTEAVIKELESRGFRVIQNATADTILTGTLTGLELRRLSQDPKTGLVQELGLSATVDFEWKDARTGKVILARRAFTAADSFAPARGGGEPIEAARFSAYSTLAKDLVGELRSSW